MNMEVDGQSPFKRHKVEDESAVGPGGDDIKGVKTESGVILLPPKPAPGTAMRRGTKMIELKSNLYQLTLPSTTVMWQYDISITKGTGKTQRELSKATGDDYLKVVKRDKCWIVFQQLKKEHPEVFLPKATLIYDRCKNIMSDMMLAGLKYGDTPKVFDVRIYARDTEQNEDWNVSMKMMSSQGVVMSDITDMCCPNLKDRNNESKRVLEIITSQILYKNWSEGGKVVVNGNKAYNLETKQKLIGCGAKYTMQGFQKNAKAIEDRKGHKGAGIAIAIDFKFGAFFDDCSVPTFLEQEFNRLDLRRGVQDRNDKNMKDAGHYLKDITILVTHAKGKSFVCKGLTPNPVSDIYFENDGKKISLQQYYRDKYSIDLKYMNMPALRGSGTTFYPIEVCRIAPFQRVPINKQSPKQMQSMIKSAAVRPAERLDIMESQMRNTRIATSETLQNLGIQMLDSVMVVKGRLLPLPTLLLGSGRANIGDRGDYQLGVRQNSRFLVGSECKRAVLLVCCPNDRDFDDHKIKTYWDNLQRDGDRLGVKLPRADIVKFIVDKRINENMVQDMFKKWAASDSERPDFVHSILPHFGGESYHNIIKLMENRTGIVTQNIKCFTMNKCLDGRGEGIRVNVLAKTNLKLGGVDSSVQVGTDDFAHKGFKEDVMVCGLAMVKPVRTAQQKRLGVDGGGEPTVVGLVARTGKYAFDMTGEHWFIPPGADFAEDIAPQIMQLTSRFFKTNKRLPNSVVFFREVDEGQFAKIVEQEVPEIRRGLKMVDKDGRMGYDPKLTVIVVRKRHNERFFPGDTRAGKNDKRPAPVQNIQPGTVVDTGICHPRDWEFYINSHTAIQGTAKPTKYNPVLDENKFTSDEMQALCHTLCYGHQIVNKAVSLPVPVYAAQDMAKRGKNLYKAWQMTEGAGSSGSSRDEGRMDLKQLNETLSVSNTALKNRKFWA